MTPQKFAEFLAKEIAGARVKIRTPSGHYPMVDRTKACIALWKPF